MVRWGLPGPEAAYHQSRGLALDLPCDQGRSHSVRLGAWREAKGALNSGPLGGNSMKGLTVESGRAWWGLQSAGQCPTRDRACQDLVGTGREVGLDPGVRRLGSNGLPAEAILRDILFLILRVRL